VGWATFWAICFTNSSGRPGLGESSVQGCQMAFFQTKNPSLGKFPGPCNGRTMLVYFKSIWSTLRPFGIFCGDLAYFLVIWFIFSRFGMMYHGKSGNPASVGEKKAWVDRAAGFGGKNNFDWKEVKHILAPFLSPLRQPAKHLAGESSFLSEAPP
jgi:hypothetical protein